jgi:hypothetical protein
MKRSKPADLVKFELVLSRRQLKGALMAFLMIGAVGVVGSETLSLVANFPSPIGIYNRLVSTGQTILAREGGRVGIGTGAPRATLEINGDTRVQTDVVVGGGVSLGGALGLASLGAPPTGGSAGQLYYDSSARQIREHTGSSWRQMHANPASYVIQNTVQASPGQVVTATCTKGSITGGGCQILNSSQVGINSDIAASYPEMACGTYRATGWSCRVPMGFPAGNYMQASAICTSSDGDIPSRGSPLACIAIAPNPLEATR